MSGQIQNLSENFFNYDRHRFFLTIGLYTYEDKKYEQSISLNTSCILSFSYINEINKLYLEGEIIYQDSHAVVDKFLEKPLTWCDVEFTQMEQKFDKDVVLEKPSELEKFTHTFFVNSIKIMKRENHIITYKISLIGGNWMKCIKNIYFSNYNKQPEPIFNIIKSMLAINDLKVDKDSFDSAISPIKINYITNGSDNTLTTIKYLLSKLYYYENKDENIKFLVYNEYDDNFRVFSFKDNLTDYQVPAILISLFKTSTENMVTEEPNELNAVSKCPKSITYESEMSYNFFDFNYNENKFLDRSVESKAIVQFKNEMFESEYYRTKYEFFKEKEYVKSGSYWNNDFDVYHSTIKTMTEDNAIVINTSGQISRKPGMYLTLNVDRNLDNITDESPEKLKELKEKYKSLEGLYVIAKVRHIITPSQNGTEKQRYRQNLVVMRNFVAK